MYILTVDKASFKYVYLLRGGISANTSLQVLTLPTADFTVIQQGK